MVLKFSRRQGEAPLLFDRQALIGDIAQHLAERFPAMVAVMPRGALQARINNSIRIALWFRIGEVAHLRFLTALRWDLAPGFYRQPEIWKLLADVGLTESARMEALGAPDMEPALQAAIAASDPAHWDDTPESFAR
ncbi:MAG: hypothetical protein HC834_07795 [Rhodospirillales bacterium]|nr:hypothetical protein [Rhodospirillales bacterium]